MNLSFEQKGNVSLFKSANGATVTITAPEGSHDSFESLGEGFWKWVRKCDTPVDRMTMQIRVSKTPEYFLVPAINYNGNGWGSGAQYSGFECDGVPWQYAWHRASIPACTYAENSEITSALFGEEAGGMSCSIYTENGETIQELIWPETEVPKTLSKRCWYPAYYGEMAPQSEFSGILMVAPFSGTRRLQTRELLDFVWRSNYREVEMDYPSSRVLQLDMLGLRQLYLRLYNGITGFCHSINWLEEAGAFVMCHRKFEIGWCGQNAAISCMFLEEYLKTGNTDLRDKALSVLDCWDKNAFLPCGLMLCHLFVSPDNVDSVPNGTIDVNIDTCNLANAASGFLWAARLCEKAGIERPSYRQRALGICDFMVRTQKESGEFAKSYFIDGSIDAQHGSIGSFVNLALIDAYNDTGDKKYLDAAIKGIDFYLGEFAINGYTTAGALDSNCIDKESGAPILRGALWAYEYTKDKKYLDAAIDVAYYLATWQYHYSEKFPEGSEISETNFDTYGSTSVSAAHNALDHYAIYWIPEYMKLSELTGNDIWKQRARAAWYSGTKLLSDGTLVIKNRVRPAGSQDESVRHTRWGRTDRRHFIPSGYCSIWQHVFRYEVKRRLGDISFLD